MVATVLVVIGRSSLTAILVVEATTEGAPTMGLIGELGAVPTAAAEATQTATSPAPHVAASTPTRKSKNSMAGDNDGFPAFSTRLRNLLLPEKFMPLGITKYDAKQDPV
jgi:hypothetical protein